MNNKRASAGETSDNFYDDDEERSSSEEARNHLAKLQQQRKVQHDSWLSNAVAQIAVDHGIQDVKELRSLIGKLRSLSLHDQSPGFQGDVLVIEKDLKSKGHPSHRKKIVEFLDLANSMAEALTNIVDSPVLSSVFVHVAKDRWSSLVVSALDLRDIAEAAAEIRSKRGNRSHPAWTADAVSLCQDFWKKHKGEKATRYFNSVKRRSDRYSADTTRPGNRFSEWFCDVMKQVAAEFTPSRCETILRRSNSRG